MRQAKDTSVIILAAGSSRRLSELTSTLPKSLLPIHGKPVLYYLLEALEQRGFVEVTIVVGYLKQNIQQAFGDHFGRMKLSYRENEEYATTGHAWSLFLARDRVIKPSLLLAHADTFFDPRILDCLMESGEGEWMMVDSGSRPLPERPVAHGKGDRITRIQFGSAGSATTLGEVMCLNLWSAKFVTRFFSFMERHFLKQGRNFNWDPLFDLFLQEEHPVVRALPCEALVWININRASDYRDAQTIVYDRVALSNLKNTG